MKFRTEYTPQKGKFVLSPRHPVLFIGSCFSENIAGRMRDCLWRGFNFSGTLYNPHSIAVALDIMLLDDSGLVKFSESLYESGGVWKSRLFDSGFNGDTPEDCLEEFKRRQKEFKENIEKGETLVVTFGTSIVYCLKESGQIVGNCHKEAAALFYEKRLTIQEIVECWDNVLDRLKARYPGVKVVFTVSPVRHLKNGFVGNARSKAVLQLAIESLVELRDWCDYFPAFEIMTDDLRDYRFYTSDLLHPSEEGIGYVWQKFQDTYLDTDGKLLVEEGEKIAKGFRHRQKTSGGGKVPSIVKKQQKERLKTLEEAWQKFKRINPSAIEPK